MFAAIFIPDFPLASSSAGCDMGAVWFVRHKQSALARFVDGIPTLDFIACRDHLRRDRDWIHLGPHLGAKNHGGFDAYCYHPFSHVDVRVGCWW